MVSIVNDYGVQNWIIMPAAYAVNEAPPENISDQRWLMMLSGVGEVNMAGTSADAWQANQVTMLGDADASVQAALKFAISQWKIPQPPATYAFFQVAQWSPFVGLSKVEAGESPNAGFGVNYWDLELQSGTDAVSGLQVENIFNGINFEVGVRDNDAWLYSVGYNIALLGNIVFQY